MEQSITLMPEVHSQSHGHILRVSNLCVNYDSNIALDNISFELAHGATMAIIGPNGAGKSTLIKVIMGMIQPQSGTIEVAADIPHRLGYVPQHDDVDWDFPVTVRDVVMMGLTRQIGWLWWPGRRHWDAVYHALERVGMAKFAKRQIGELSGGQRRRAFIARALVRQTDFLLLDEPFAGVDVGAQTELMDVLDQLHTEGLTILLSTHDLALAFSRFEEVMALRRRIIAIGPARQVYTPDTLSQLYGGRLATWDNGQQVMVFVDDHACDGC